MRLLFLGFGTVGQGLPSCCSPSATSWRRRYGFDVDGHRDRRHAQGERVRPGRGSTSPRRSRWRPAASRSPRSIGGGQSWDALAMAEQAEADVLLEATYTDIKTGEPATEPHPGGARARRPRA